MTTTMKERIARAIFDKLEGPVANQDFARQQAQWVLAQEVAEAVLDALYDPDVEMIAAFWRQKNNGTQEIGETGDAKDDYSAYRAMIDHIRSEGKE